MDQPGIMAMLCPKPDASPDAGSAGESAKAPYNIVPLDLSNANHRVAYKDLNLAWIEKYFAVEPRDRLELEDPEASILSGGGRIFIAEAAGAGDCEVLGTCALVAEPDGAYELVKMAVRDSAKGRGVGRALGCAAIAEARALGAPHIELVSNTSLVPAISLYLALGFVEVPLPPSDYVRANIKMVLDLRSSDCKLTTEPLPSPA